MYKQRNCRWMGDEDSHPLCADSCADNYLPSPALNQRATQVQVMIICSKATLLHISQHSGAKFLSRCSIESSIFVGVCVCVVCVLGGCVCV